MSQAALARGRRLAVLALVTLAFFTLAVLRLAWVGVVLHPELAERAVKQRAQTVSLRPARGRILDREGVPLAGGGLAYRVVAYPAVVGPDSPGLARLSIVTGVPVEVLRRKLAAGGVPVFLADGLDAEAAAAVTALGLEGVAVVADQVRYLPGGLAGHVVGYLAGDHGADGLEKAWDEFLVGRGPELLALFVDGLGRPLAALGWRKVRWTEGVPGGGTDDGPADVVTTLDHDIQAAVEEVMDRRVDRGAVVVLDPRSGDVLAMASRPGFDPTDLPSVLDRAGAPLVNRAIAAYPVGSVFKPVVLAAALERGVVRPWDRLVCRGAVVADGHRVTCTAFPSGGHGELGLEQALAESCNVAFVELGRLAGWESVAGLARRLGFGRTTGVGLPGEAVGSLPGGPGAPPEAACGLGGVTATPLQVARVYAAIAAGGRPVEPRLVTRLRFVTGASARVSRLPRERVGGSGGGTDAASSGRESDLAAVTGSERLLGSLCSVALKGALARVVEEGTGAPAGVLPGVAGKTGTVETGRSDASGREVFLGWFAGFWPVWDPRLVVVVLVEDTTEGGPYAAAVFGEILREVQKKDKGGTG